MLTVGDPEHVDQVEVAPGTYLVAVEREPEGDAERVTIWITRLDP